MTVDRAALEAVEAERDETVGNLVVELNRAESRAERLEALIRDFQDADSWDAIRSLDEVARELLDSLPGETK